jgi:hypothetical protein
MERAPAPSAGQPTGAAIREMLGPIFGVPLRAGGLHVEDVQAAYDRTRTEFALALRAALGEDPDVTFEVTSSGGTGEIVLEGSSAERAGALLGERPELERQARELIVLGGWLRDQAASRAFEADYAVDPVRAVQRHAGLLAGTAASERRVLEVNGRRIDVRAA